MYTVGKERIPFFAACGQMWEILKPDGSVLCVIVGSREQAEEVVRHLNVILNGV